MLGSLWAITKNAFTEVIRQPIYGILLIVGMALIAFSPLISMFTLMEDVKLVIDMGLGTIFMVGIALAVLSATQVISREIEAKTAGAIISKPVGRFVFVSGKFLGVSLAMALASYLFALILVMTVRMDVPSSTGYEMDWPAFWGEVGPFVLASGLALYANYFYRWNFTSTAVLLAFPLYTLSFIVLCVVAKDWSFEWIATTFLEKDCQYILIAAVLIFLGVWIVSAVAVAASTRVNVVANVLICGSVFFVGMVSHYLFGWAVDDSWARWVPEPGDEAMVISGKVSTSDGKALAEVAMWGSPQKMVTDGSGSYWLEVKPGGTGEIIPHKVGYTFSPSSRSYKEVTSSLEEQDYSAIPSVSGGLRYAAVAGNAAAWLAYHVVPSLQLFWVADQFVRPEPYIPLSYLGKAALYAGTWCAGMVALGSFLFERREII